MTARIGVALTIPAAHVSALWAPNALLLAVLLLAPRRSWWVYLLAVLPAHVAVLLSQEGALAARVVIQYGANCATALIGALALSAVVPGLRRIDSTRSALAFILLGGVLAPLITSLAAAWAYYALSITQEFWLTVVARTLTNSFAIVTVVPPILHVAAWLREERHTLSLARATEMGLLALSLAAVGTLAIAMPSVLTEHYWGTLLVLFVAALWAAVHFGPMAACSAMLLLGVLATSGVVKQSVLLVGHSPEQSAIWLILVLVCASVTLLLLSATREERRGLERSGAASEARLSAVFARSIVPAVIWRSDGRIVEANRAFLQLTGYQLRDLKAGAINAGSLLHFTDGARGLPSLDTDGGPVERELVLREGRRIPVLVSGCRFPGTASEGTACIFDLSSMRRVESERREAQSLHAAVLASLQDQIAVLDRAGTIIEANPAWQRTAEQPGSRAWERVRIGDSFLHTVAGAARTDPLAVQVLQCIRDVLAGTGLRGCLEFSSDAQGTFWYQMSVEPLRRPEGGAVITRTDITASKRVMNQAREQGRQLTHLGRAAVLGELSGAFAHELAQPLTSILGNAEAALQNLQHGSADHAEIEEILRDIIRDDVRAAEVIQRLRSMLTQGEIERQHVDLNQIVREVLALARSDLITRNVSVVTQLSQQTLFVLADPVQLQQVLLNLIINACEAMSDSAPAERQLIITTRLADDGSTVECAVSDFGGGVKPEYMERIFQPFVTTKKHGLGLGLAICRSIIEAHGGRLWAENRERGAVFTFTARTGA